MLLKSRFRSFLQQCVDTLIQVVTGHVVVDDAQSSDKDRTLVATHVYVKVRLAQVALLLNELHVLFARPAN
mgnify:CR=1 FL=1|jgi:predicted house-cleaning NTP pyrophosphatase (Maf/HAM1 superfamily)